MKPATSVENSEVCPAPVWELYIEQTPTGPHLIAVYHGPDAPRPEIVARGETVTRFNKSNCALTLAAITIKTCELRGELRGHRGEERRNILNTEEPKTWLHTLADTYARGVGAELERLFSKELLRLIGVHGGRAANMRIDPITGKLASPACLDSHVTETFPARLRILVSEAGGQYRPVEDAQQLLKLAEQLEDTRGFWESHLFPMDLRSSGARVAGQTRKSASGPAFMFSPDHHRATKPLVRPQTWHERGESSEFSEMKLRFLKLLRTGQHDHECIDMIENNPALCATRFPPNRDSILLTAITHKRIRVVNYLLERADVDVNQPNDYGVTPLLKAANINNFNLVKTLVEKKGADFRAVNEMGANVIYEAAFGAGQEAFAIIHYFHSAPYNVPCDRQTNDGFLPLTVAVWRRCDERAIRYLIENTADLNVADYYGETPYYKAIKYGYFEAVNLLINLGGDKLDRTKTPGRHLTDRGSVLFGAAHHGDLKRVRELLKEGNDDIDEAELEFERSPLHEAVDMGHLQIVEELISHGANVFIQNHHGRIPRDFLPWKRASIVQQIEDILEKAEEEWIEKEMTKLPGLRTAF